MADNRPKLKSRNVDDYIQNVDEKVLKERGKPFLYITGGLVALGLFVIGFGFAVANKQPEKTYAELANEKPKEQTVIKETETKEENKTSFLGRLTGKKEETQKEINRNIPIYLSEPSEDICMADPLSGSIQIGEYMFTLPCKLTAFTDVGFEVMGWGEQATQKEFSLDLPIKAKRGTAILIAYDEYSVYEAFLFNTEEEMTLIDSTVVSVSQRKSSSYFNEQAQPLFAAGGVHIGCTTESVDNYFGQFENYTTNNYSGQRLFNGPVKLDIADNDLIDMVSDKGLNEISGIRVYKNY